VKVPLLLTKPLRDNPDSLVIMMDHICRLNEKQEEFAVKARKIQDETLKEMEQVKYLISLQINEITNSRSRDIFVDRICELNEKFMELIDKVQSIQEETHNKMIQVDFFISQNNVITY
jgi:hypothetical protein